MFCVYIVTGQVAIVCSSRKLHLSCPQGHVIVVEGAVYGMLPDNACNEFLATSYCQNRAALGLVASKCSGQRSCEPIVNTFEFRSLCPDGGPRGLLVQYQCVSG